MSLFINSILMKADQLISKCNGGQLVKVGLNPAQRCASRTSYIGIVTQIGVSLGGRV